DKTRSFHQPYRPSERRACELLRRRRLAEEKSLSLAEAHLAHGEEFGLGFDAFRDGAGAIAVGEIENAMAHRLFQAVDGATGDEFPVDLDLGEGKVGESGEQGPFRPEVVDRDGDVVKSQPPREVLRKFEMANDLEAVDLDGQPAESRMI